MLNKNLFIPLIVSVCSLASASAQYAFKETVGQKFHYSSHLAPVADSLKKEFGEKGLKWPAKYMFVRAFKHEKQMEVWVKQEWKEAFQLFKVYRVCATSGTYGPKRKEGDKQIPEGFYYINEFNPNSNYHLALGLNYPNISDQLLSDADKPGGDIYIHGNCVTVGCLPLTDSLIEQVYYLASVVKEQGQDFIPVHIYPLRYDNKKAIEQFKVKTKNKQDIQKFSLQIKDAYEFFEDTHQLPAVMVDKTGNYVIAYNPETPKVTRLKIFENDDPSDPYTAWSLEEKVDRVPSFKDGTSALQRWLFSLSKELVPYLDGQPSASLQVEFVVDQDGNTATARVVKGGNSQMNKIVKQKFEKELKWNPAMKDGKPVNTKLKQNLNITAPEDL